MVPKANHWCVIQLHGREPEVWLCISTTTAFGSSGCFWRPNGYATQIVNNRDVLAVLDQLRAPKLPGEFARCSKGKQLVASRRMQRVFQY